MQPDDHLDRIDEILRSEPTWQPPAGFAARLVAMHRVRRIRRDWSGRLVALERGALAGVGVYASLVVWQAAAPSLLTNVSAAAWVTASAALVWAAYVSRSLFSRI